MKKVLLVMVVCGCSFLMWGQEYKLVWEENFNGTSLDSNVWNVEQNEGVWNIEANRELQHYAYDNVKVGDDGIGNNCLILTAKKERYKGYSFTSGRVDTKGKYRFKYGKIEARIKLPDLANGLWPAFWLLGDTCLLWPACGEIDIMEAGHAEGINNQQQNLMFGGALHWEHENGYAGHGTSSVAPAFLHKDYHTYTLVWDEANIYMYLDDSSVPYFNMNINGVDAEEFRDYSMYVILNLAVGGQFPAIYEPKNLSAPLPAKMWVDYIKVYQKQ
jgi:beta-glucanase (GH16 family)